MVTGMGNGLTIGVVVFIFFKGNLLTATFTTTPGVIQQSYNYLKGFVLETIVTAVLFSMVGYFNGHDQTLWVMTQGLIKTFLIRLPLAY
ncbi:MATE family efflux transporter [Sharpea azabuensis]|uniref:MATE family efflux transporter n=1 Tax=Sharpea azabuensis TaxID=322505 RepID=UPI0006920790|nr:MATE family efflux transporter [Sharpea azabuensis]